MTAISGKPTDTSGDGLERVVEIEGRIESMLAAARVDAQRLGAAARDGALAMEARAERELASELEQLERARRRSHDDALTAIEEATRRETAKLEALSGEDIARIAETIIERLVGTGSP
jgi:hypothetical protein